MHSFALRGNVVKWVYLYSPLEHDGMALGCDGQAFDLTPKDQETKLQIEKN